MTPTVYDTALWDGTSAGGSVSVGAGLTAREIQITNPPSAVTIVSGSGGLTLGSGGVDMSKATQNLTINTPILMASTQAWNVANGRTLTVTGGENDGGMGYGLSTTGPGTVILDGSNLFSGALTVSAGKLKLGNGASNWPGISGPVSIAGGATLEFNTIASGTISSLGGSGTLLDSGTTGVITVNEPPGYSGTIGTIEGAAGSTILLVGAPTSTPTIKNILDSPGQTVVFDGGRWILAGGGAYTSSLVIESGTVLTLSGAGQNLLDVESLLFTGGSFVDQATYGLRMGNTVNANASATGPFTGVQTGGFVSVTNSGFEIGGNTGAYPVSYTLSSGTLSLTTNLDIGANASNGGQTIFELDGGKLLDNSSIDGDQGIGAMQAFVWTGGELAAATYNATNLVSSTGTRLAAGTNTLTNEGGILAPGDIGIAGKMTITGNYAVTSSNGVLAIDIGGASQATGFQSGQYDYVAVSGSTHLAGALQVSLINGYTPSATCTYTVLASTGGLSGSFSNVTFGRRLITSGLEGSFVVGMTSTSITLSSYQVFIPPPVITAPPVSGTATEGQPFMFSVTATGTSIAPINYQWYFDGAAIASATNASYVIYSAQPANSGAYDVVVSNSGGSVTSSAATLSVYVIPPPAIMSNLTPTGVQGSGFVYQILASGTVATYTSSGLPAGLSLNALTGLISGVPSAGGSDSVTIGAVNSSGTGTALLSIVIQPAVPVITSPASAVCYAGSAFAYQISASNSPTGFGALGLPPVLSVNTSTGLISGAAALAGGTTVMISASNATGVGVGPLALTVNPPITYWNRSAVSTAWQTGTNWQGGTAPVSSLTANVAGFDLTTYSYQPNAGATSIAGLQIGDGSTVTAPLTIAGTALSIGAAGINMSPNAGAATLTAPITLGAPQTWSNGSGALLTGSGTIATGRNVLIISGSGPVAVSASITGTAGVVMAGPGSLTINNQLSTAGQAFTVLGGTATLNSGRSTSANIDLAGGMLLIGGAGASNRYSSAANNETLVITGGTFSYIPNGGYGIRLNGDNGPAFSGNSYAFTATQSGGLVSLPGGSSGNFNMGNSSGGCSTIFNLAGSGTLSGTNGSNWVIGADTAGASVTAFNMSGGKLLVAGGMSGSQGTGARQAFVWTGGTLVTYTYTATNLTSGTAITVSPSSNTLTNAGGVLAPGDVGVPGLTTITGNYAVTSTNAVLAIDLSGTNPASAFQDTAATFDRVKVTGSANLGGALDVTLINNFVPASTGTFTILGANPAVSGSFSNVAFGSRLATTDGLGSFLVSNMGNAVVLSNFIQTGPLPVAVTAAASNITSTGAVLNGTVNANEHTTSVTFEYGPNTAYGTALAGAPASVSGSAATAVSCSLASLAADSTYHFRVDGSSSAGVQDGADMVFTTNPSAPSVTSLPTASGNEGTPFFYQITGSNNPVGFDAIGLPTGLAVNTESGIISGIPAATGSSNVSLYVTNFGGSGGAPLLLAILPPLPSAPATLLATPGNGTVGLTWNQSANATGYDIFRSATSGTSYSLIASNVTTTSFLDTSATNWTTWYYVATAVGPGGESAYSPQVSAMPQSPAFTASETTMSTSLNLGGTNATVYFNNSVLGHAYQLQYSATLQPGSWRNYGSPQAGTGGTLAFPAPVDATEPQRFYRFLIQQ